MGLCEGMNEWSTVFHWPVSILKGEDHTWLHLPEPTQVTQREKASVLCVGYSLSLPSQILPHQLQPSQVEKVYGPWEKFCSVLGT